MIADRDPGDEQPGIHEEPSAVDTRPGVSINGQTLRPAEPTTLTAEQRVLLQRIRAGTEPTPPTRPAGGAAQARAIDDAHELDLSLRRVMR